MDGRLVVPTTVGSDLITLDTDGQVLIIGDMLGYFEAFTPKFVKKYANLAEVITKAFGEYIDDVRTGKVPEEKHCYRMIEGELDKLDSMLKNLPPQS